MTPEEERLFQVLAYQLRVCRGLTEHGYLSIDRLIHLCAEMDEVVESGRAVEAAEQVAQQDEPPAQWLW